MSEPLLIASDLRKQFKVPKPFDVLQGVNLTVHAGETIALVGSSGSGKTTLLSILASLDRATSGTVTILGKPIEKWDLSILRNQILGFVFQQYHLLEECSVLENVLMPAYIARKSTQKNSEAYLLAIELLGKIGMAEQKYFPVKQLSGGEQQRVAIARALCNNPSILFADEPSGNLDDKNASAIYDLLLSFCKSMNKALVIVTHDMSLANLCSRILYIESGKLLERK